MFKDSVLKFLKLDSLVEHITGYVEARIALMKVEMQEELAKVLAKALLGVVITAVLTLFILLFSMAIAFKIGESLGAFGGFSIVAGFYFLIGLITWLFRNSIAEKLESMLQEVMKKNKKQD